MSLLFLAGCSSVESQFDQSSESSDYHYAVSSDFNLELDALEDPNLWTLMWNEDRAVIQGILKGPWGEIKIKGEVHEGARFFEFSDISKKYGPHAIQTILFSMDSGSLPANVEVEAEAFNSDGKFYTSQFLATIVNNP